MAQPPRYVCDRCQHTVEARPGGLADPRRLASRLVFTTLRLAGCRCPQCRSGRFVRSPDAAQERERTALCAA